MPLSPDMRGALFMTVSMAGFTINDALVKELASDISMAQVMLIRGVFASLMIALLAWHRGALHLDRRVLHPMVALRVVGEAGATVSFLAALAVLPLANVSAVLQALPLAVTMGAALFLGEKVGWRRWTAILAGFFGVLVVIRPGFEGFSLFSILTLVTVGFAAARDLATRKIPAEVPSLMVSTVTAVAVTILGAVLIVPYGGWYPVSGGSVATLFAAAVLLLFGYQFIIMSMREGDISFIAPFRYTALLWAILLGYVMFGDVPDAAMIVGSAIVVGSGLYTLYREQRVGARGKPAAAGTGPATAPGGFAATAEEARTADGWRAGDSRS